MGRQDASRHDKDKKYRKSRSRSRGRSPPASSKKDRHSKEERKDRSHDRHDRLPVQDTPRRQTDKKEEEKYHKKDKDRKKEKDEHKKEHKRKHRSSSSSSSSPQTVRRQERPKTPKHEEKADLSAIYDLTKDVHESFQVSGEFLDFKEVRGLALSKTVRDTPISRRFNIAGRDIRTVRIVDLCYKGIENWYLRAISAGRFVNIEFTRSIKESIFISRVLKNMRPKQNSNEERFDLDKIGAAYAATNNKKFDTDEDKRDIYNDLADHLFRSLNQLAPTSDATKMQEKIRQLEMENSKLRANPTTKPKPKAKASSIASYFGKDSKKKDNNKGQNKGKDKEEEPEKDEEDEEEDQEDGDSDEEQEVLKPIRRATEERKVLQKKFPKGPKAKAIEDWIKTLDFTHAKKLKIDKMANQVYQAFMSLDVADRVGCKEVVADWGAPIDFLTKVDTKGLIKLAAIAKALAA